MNEELKIIIKAVSDEAKKGLAEVKDELKGIEKESKKTGQVLDEALSGVAKGVAAAVASVAALTAAMVKLGKSAQDINKGFSKMKSSFESAGSSAKAATKYYKELFGILGDHDRTVETGQSLARITTDPGALSDYKNIVAGAVSKYGDGYNSEALTENISETIAAAKITGDLERVLVEAGISADGFNAALAATTSTEERELLIRSTLNGVLGQAGKAYIQANQATILYNQSQANLNITLAQAAAYTTPFLTSINNLGASLLTLLAPALEQIAIYLTAFIELMISAVQWIGNFFGIFSSGAEQTTADVAGYQAAMENYNNSLRNYFSGSNNELDENLDKINAVKKATMGFDELNIVSSQTPVSAGSTGGGGIGGVGSLPKPPNPADYGIGGNMANLEDFKEDLEEAKSKLKVIGAIIGGIATAIGLWKLISFVQDLWDSYQTAKELKGVFEQLKDDLDPVSREFGMWSDEMKECNKNMEKAQGKLDKFKGIAGTFLIIAGALAAILGYADAWVNGLDWGNFAAILLGLAAVVGGVALKFGGIATPIMLIVAGIAALVIGIKDLVTNGYSMEAVIMVAVGAIAVLIGVVWALNAALLANPITWIVVAIMALVAAFVILWNECDAFRQFWIDLWDGICAAFDATVAWLGDACEAIGQFFVDAWNWIVGVWNSAGEWFGNIWKSIKNAFSSVGKWFSDIFTGAWNGIKKAFSAVGSFFSGIWNSIKSIFSKVGSVIGNAVSGAFKSAINWVLEKAIGLINGFIKAINFAIDIINLIPGVELEYISLIKVPKLARGGIATSSTLANIGEAGKEAVLPLENNTEWMDVLADRIAARQSSPSRIALMLDGKELGYATINSINNITKQTGSLQLSLA